METVEAYRGTDELEASIDGVDFCRIRATPQDPQLDKEHFHGSADDTDDDVFEEGEEEEEEEMSVADALIQAAEKRLEAVQEKLLEIVQESRGEPVLLEDDISEALDSLSISLVLTKVAEAFGVQVPIAQAYDFPTVARLARHIAGVILKTTTAPLKEAVALPWRELQDFWIAEGGDMPEGGGTPGKLLPKHPRGEEAVHKAIFGTPGGPLLIEPGTSVEVLKLKARPDLNGRVGSILRFDFGLMRWEVQIEGEDHPKLLREGNVRPIGPTLPDAADGGATEDDFGLLLVRAGKGSPVYVAHSLGADALDLYLGLDAEAAPATASSAFPGCPVYMLVFDKIAAECTSVQSLAELHANRIACFERWRRFHGAAGGTVMVAGSSSGCALAYEVAGRLKGQAGALGTELVLFDDGLGVGAPAEAKDGASAPLGPADTKGTKWLGSEVEAALLVARLLGAPDDWALSQRRELGGLKPAKRDAEALQMQAFWDHGAKIGVPFGRFRKLMAASREKALRLESLVTGYKPTSGSKLDVKVRMIMGVEVGKKAAAAGGH